MPRCRRRSRVRAAAGPTLIDALTYRVGGHAASTPRPAALTRTCRPGRRAIDRAARARLLAEPARCSTARSRGVPRSRPRSTRRCARHAVDPLRAGPRPGREDLRKA
ncbi:MAG: hypothetical protein IPG91_05515 [Ideonella sp.]|nr:hypothetical protein [Ideonella sp.]